MTAPSKMSRLASRHFRRIFERNSEYFVAGPEFLWAWEPFASRVPSKYVRFLAAARELLGDDEQIVSIFDNSPDADHVTSAIIITDREAAIFQDGNWTRVPYGSITELHGLPREKSHARSDQISLIVRLVSGDQVSVPTRFGYVYSLWSFLARPILWFKADGKPS